MTHTLTDAQSLTITDAQSLTIADALPLTPPHRYPSPRRIGDALFFRNPIRTERSGGRMGSQPTHPQRFGDALLPHQPDRALLTSSSLAVVVESDRASGHAFS